MPSEVFEQQLDLTSAPVEAIDGFDCDAYPYPRLQLGHGEIRHNLNAVVLENAFSKAVFLPELGGRLISLVDKRTGVALWPESPVLNLEAGGPRGVRCRTGLQILVRDEERLNALGAVAYSLSEDGLWMSEICFGEGLSWHAHYVLAEDEAVLRLELRVFNRTLAPQRYNAGLLAWLPEGSLKQGNTLVSANGALSVYSEIVHLRDVGCGHAFQRFENERWLAPRQLETLHFEIVPHTGLSPLSGVSSSVSLSFENGIRLQVSKPIPESVLLLRNSSGEQFQSKISPKIETLFEIPSSSLPEGVVSGTLLDANGEAILEFDTDPLAMAQEPVSSAKLPCSNSPVIRSEKELREACFEPETRYLAHLELAHLALVAGQYALANERFEQALLYNGEDHLAWWGKAISLRQLGEEAEGELLNAHYLAPFEPALKVEAFLNLPQQTAKEPSPLLDGLAPEAFLDAACLLLEWKQWEDAVKLLDEATRRWQMPMICYLEAYAFLQGSRMEFEAAQRVQAAEKMQLQPPYPHRPIEKEALKTLASRFESKRLTEYLEAMQTYGF